MKKVLIIMMVAMMGATASAASQGQELQKNRRGGFDPKKVTEMKVERMQQRLMLSDSQSEKFAELYKEYLAAVEATYPQADKKCDAKEGKKCERLSDKQLVKMQKERLDAERKRAELKSKYYDKMSKVLNAKQLERVFFGKESRRPMPMGGNMRKGGDCCGDAGNKAVTLPAKREGQKPVVVCPEQGVPAEMR